MKKSLCLLTALLMVCFVHVAFAGSGNTSFRSVNHKGYNTKAPENTLPAFERSAEMGYRYVETDISFTKDGVPVLLHNPSINVMARNPDGSELPPEDIMIDTLTYEEVLQYDFTKGMKGYKGTKIARLDDFLDLCRAKSLHPYLELKKNGDYKKDQIIDLVKLVRSKGMAGKVSWISFEAEYLKWVSQEDPKARLGYLNVVSDEETMKESVKAAKALKTSKNEVFLDLANKTEFVTYDYSLCEKEGLPVEIWVNDELNAFMGITERDVLETLDPYVTGATVDKYIYGKPSIELSPSVYTYNGEVRKPAVTVRLNGKKLKKSDYKLTWSEGCKDPGTYQVTARLRKGILAGAGTAEFVIMEAAETISISDCNITVKDRVYTGKAITPKVTVKYGDKTLKAGRDYTLDYNKKLTDIGPATVTVKGKGDFSGSKKVAFKVIPKGTTFTKLTGGKGQIKLAWEQPENITGYQIQYDLKKDFKDAKEVNKKKKKIVTETIKKLQGNKTYYVRIRTFKKVGKKVYYSTWSEAKTVRTKAGKAKNGSTVQNLEITMSTGEELDLNLMLPYDISDYGQTWESSDEEIATVDGKGIATALQPGTVVITMTNGDDEQVVFTVTVSEMEISLGEEEPILLADDIIPGDDAELPLEIELEIPMAE